MLLAGRAFQGVGASGVQNLTVIVLADGVSLADNAVNNTIFMGVFGIRYVEKKASIAWLVYSEGKRSLKRGADIYIV